MSESISPQVEQLLAAKMAEGGYATADELLVDALGALDELRARHEELRASIQSRLASAGRGLSIPLDLEEFKADARRRLAATRPSAP